MYLKIKRKIDRVIKRIEKEIKSRQGRSIRIERLGTHPVYRCNICHEPVFRCGHRLSEVV